MRIESNIRQSSPVTPMNLKNIELGTTFTWECGICYLLEKNVGAEKRVAVLFLHSMTTELFLNSTLVAGYQPVKELIIDVVV